MSTRQKLQGFFDLICLCYSSWKRLCSRRHILSAWGEMTGAGFPPFFISVSSHSVQIVCLTPSMMAIRAGRFPAWTVASVYLSPFHFSSFLTFLMNGSLKLWGETKTKKDKCSATGRKRKKCLWDKTLKKSSAYKWVTSRRSLEDHM